jgi:hypothetical protein
MERCVEARDRNPGVQVIGLDDFGDKFAFPIRFSGPKAKKKPMCGAPFDNVVIDWDGTVRVCCNTWVKAGNLYQTPLSEIFHGRGVTAFQKKMKKDDYLWCSPNCSDNASPTKLSLAHKYAYELKQDPRNFLLKVQQKVKQVQGKWVTPRKKRSKPLEDRKVRLPVVTAQSAEDSRGGRDD